MKRKLSHIEIIDYLIRLELVVDNKVIKFATKDGYTITMAGELTKDSFHW